MYVCARVGLLELDLVMGNWANKHVPKLDTKGLDEVALFCFVSRVVCYLFLLFVVVLLFVFGCVVVY